MLNDVSRKERHKGVMATTRCLQGRFSLFKLLFQRTVISTPLRPTSANNVNNSRGISTATKCAENNVDLQSAIERYSDIELMPYRVGSLKLKQPFSESGINAFPYCLDQNNSIVDPYGYDTTVPTSYQNHENDMDLTSFCMDFKTLFKNGWKEMTEMDTPQKTSNLITPLQNKNTVDRIVYLQEALKSLEHFFEKKEFHQKCLSEISEGRRKRFRELEAIILLANHLFSPLVSSNDAENGCIITSDSKQKQNWCPCKENCDRSIIYGNTGFGSKYLWYGKPDIVLNTVGGGAVGVIFKPISKKDGLLNFEKTSSHHHQRRQIIEVKIGMQILRSTTTVLQAVSQAITFSFYQRKLQKEWKMDGNITSVIPTIVTTGHYFDVYLYDAENDVLLRNVGYPIPIFEKESLGDMKERFTNRFNTSSILQLWMLINHVLLQPVMTADQLKVLRGSCSVKERIESCGIMEKIENSLKLGSRFKSDDEGRTYILKKIFD